MKEDPAKHKAALTAVKANQRQLGSPHLRHPVADAVFMFRQTCTEGHNSINGCSRELILSGGELTRQLQEKASSITSRQAFLIFMDISLGFHLVFTGSRPNSKIISIGISLYQKSYMVLK